ncbi:MAG TPA: E2/UBC family protein [Chthoniobacterales bacterium]|nr:E2/UBC family protein [Chthoniobacterales bacterium]
MNDANKSQNATKSCTDRERPTKPAAKWAVTVNDEPIPMPQQTVSVAVIKAQSAVDESCTLVRDHGSPDDVVLSDDTAVDLSEGNVFYTLAGSQVKTRPRCDTPPKLAYFVDDRPEITINPNQTGTTIRDLFGLHKHVNLIRDYESSHDEPVQLADRAPFHKGPVFITRREHVRLSILVNQKRFTEGDGVKSRMTGRQIALLVSDNPECTDVFRVKGTETEPVPLDKEIRVENCDEFRVIRNNVRGGYEPSRVDRELKNLRKGGCRVDFVQQPMAAVIYHDVPTRPGYRHTAQTDVLVAVPSGYPGQPLDGAYLPEGSPLLGRVAGSPQGFVFAADRKWQLVSYHPHAGGGAPAWNKDKHGFHTYLDEIVCWLHRANN